MQEKSKFLVEKHEKNLYNGFLKIDKYHLRQQKPNGEWTDTFTREVMVRGNAAAVLIHDPVLDKFLFTKQLRTGSLEKGNPFITEIVAGMIDKGETGKQAIEREAIEESGINIFNIEYINKFYPSVGGTTEEVEVYYAEADLSNVEQWKGCPEENEIIEVVTYSKKETFEKLKNGELGTASNQIALYWFMAFKNN